MNKLLNGRDIPENQKKSIKQFWLQWWRSGGGEAPVSCMGEQFDKEIAVFLSEHVSP